MLLVVLIFLTVISCSDNEILEQNKTIPGKQQKLIDDDSNLPRTEHLFGIRLNLGLHRGRKWSKRNNVRPCSQSFGICLTHVQRPPNVEIQIPSFPDNSDPCVIPGFPCPSSTVYKGILLKLKFLVPIKAKPGDIFYSSNDAPFPLPKEIAQRLGYKQVIIQPADYKYHSSIEGYPYGYVLVSSYVK